MSGFKHHSFNHDIINTKLCTLLQATTAENINSAEKQLQLNSYEMSCHSLDLAQWLPYFSAFVRNVSNYADIQQCVGPCKNKITGPKKPIYVNVYELKEGDYLTLICPEYVKKLVILN